MSTFPNRKVVFFVTGNFHKFYEARIVLAEYKISSAMLNIGSIEIQDDNLDIIARISAIETAKKSKMPVLVEDAGLFIKALKGFPGPYSSYIYRKLGTRGILKILGEEKIRDAYFQSSVAFAQELAETKMFKGRIDGRIKYKEKGTKGFGYDPIFEPLGGNGKSFAEMTIFEKNKYSHRAKALRKFARWYSGYF